MRGEYDGPVRLTTMGKVSSWYDTGLRYTVNYYAGGIPGSWKSSMRLENEERWGV